ncbi:hypothetical protein BDA96_07G098900 [Sorghum bicolor]|uniref:Uncharacterized protein n=2 Tax=Sorghum bicolor TaxID=4558 RepID=A0A921QM27_SORBI|nr:uncharacterized protein LOC8073267 [Sorghum bicolor]EES13617.1 hypothetical protein SORBI_3007G092500 [Sorghum bicolor]KAG0523147.1 hypothetical protein BDA96_07G098900 [Sorghum bicolor]|eukprot:XP_002444122.1 uncharacterized protein LOC8073267 [Sorghum bicolor]
MAPSRRRNNSSLFESSTIITANLIMASSSFLLSRIAPRVATASPPPPPTTRMVATSRASAATSTRSVEPMAGCKTILMKPVDGQDGKVDQRAEMFIRSFRERTLSETAHFETANAGARPQPQARRCPR